MRMKHELAGRIDTSAQHSAEQREAPRESTDGYLQIKRYDDGDVVLNCSQPTHSDQPHPREATCYHDPGDEASFETLGRTIDDLPRVVIDDFLLADVLDDGSLQAVNCSEWSHPDTPHLLQDTCYHYPDSEEKFHNVLDKKDIVDQTIH